MGPGDVAMAALGDKIASTLIAQSCGVPCVTWSGQGITVNFKDTGTVDDVAFQKSCVTSAEHASEVGQKMGYPIMVKASEGGGGKGIRVVKQLSEMASAYRQVAGEVAGSPIFLMTMMKGARHLEVQLMADAHGEAIALSGRDCSVQRRHQKIIEEGPQCAAPPETWVKMEAAAVALAKEVGYKCAGTVEYLYVPATDEFYFLELNPRLQVEHPCSEWITRTNIPATMLNVTMGLPLGNIPDIRNFYDVPTYGHGKTPIDFKTMTGNVKGHVVAGRITAENPEEGFQPTSGSITELTFRNVPNVWGYFSTYAGVHEFSDSQFGHVFAWGETREAARRTMVCALMELQIRGDIRTTVEYLITLMETDAFRDNEISTEWLDGLIANKIKTASPDIALSTICGAMYKAYTREQEYLSGIRDCLEKGQIPPKAKSFINFNVELILDDVKYNYDVARRGPTLFEVNVNGSAILTEMRVLDGGALHICVDGKSHVVYAKEEPAMLRLTIDGQSVAFSREYDPTQIESVMAGKLVRNLVATGEHVNKGDDIAELEVMKMYIAVQAPESGIIENTMLEGAALSVGDLIGRLTLDDPSKVKKATAFTGTLPEMRPPIVHGDKVHQLCRAAYRRLSMIMAGYQTMNDTNWASDLGTAMETLQACTLNPLLGLAEIEECLSTISSKIPDTLSEQLEVLVAKSHGEHQQGKAIRYIEFQEAIAACLSSLDAESQTAVTNTLAPLEVIVSKYVDGSISAFTNACLEFLQMYVDVEGMFQKVKKQQTNEEMIYTLREQCSSDPGVIMEKMISHKNLENKNTLVVHMLNKITATEGVKVEALVDVLTELASWQSPACVDVSRTAREMLVKHTSESSVLMVSGISEKLDLIGTTTGSVQLEHLQSVADNPAYMSHVLLGFVFSSQNPKIQAAALRAYVLRIYKGYLVSNWTEVANIPGVLLCTKWNFAAGEAEGGRPSSPMRSLDRRVDSFESLADNDVQRMGEIVVLESIAAMKRSLATILEAYAAIIGSSNVSEIRPMNNLNIFMRNEADGTREDARIADIHMALTAHKALLRKCSLRSVTVVLLCDDSSHNFYSFPASLDFEENPIHRHIDPALAYQLGLDRLSEFNLQRYPTKMDDYNAFYAEHESDRRFFVRTLVRTAESLSSRAKVTMPGVEKAFTESLTVLENAMTDSSQRFERLNMNHIFLNLLATVETDSELDDILSDCSIVFKRMYAEHASEMDNLRVSDVEISLTVQIRDTAVPLLFTLSSPSAHLMQMYVYKEVYSSTMTKKLLEDISVQPGQAPGPMHQKPSNEPYKTLDILQQKRLRAAVLGGNYVYDFADIFAKALEGIWKLEAESMRDLGMKAASIPLRLVKSVELALDKDGKLVEIDRPPAQNKVGMLAWRYTLCTPEYPEGRDLIVIANDITVQAGSFGPQEDFLFDAASKLARAEGIPRVYIAANSGARIGLAEEVRSCFKAAWKDPSDPSKGFDYLYLTSEDYHRLCADEAHKSKSINATKIVEAGEERWQIKDIIGEKDGLGVECLAGSGLIAGETSKAYDEIFTLTYVMSRSVGIGAYLVRLGQRVIQKKTEAPIILTGMESLNKLLGRDVYQSNSQLGGIRVMYANGVSHLVVDDDLEGVNSILSWLAFVPKTASGKLPIKESADPIGRHIDFIPTKTGYNTREMLGGREEKGGKWVSGFFDKDSFIETLAGWAKNVIVGRARLGGIPMGVIAVETVAVDKVMPADPADPTTQEVVQPQAAQVWFPDSSFKTATAISDFNREKLPLMIFANWRGFSGGTRDMFDEILKFGSYIVDELVGYKQPVMVYIPRHAELRGGAWVVVDPNINSDVMEMFADTHAAGGVLEAEGTVVVKYRKPMLLKTMRRLDPTLQHLDDELQMAISKMGKGSALVEQIIAQISAREKELLPIYQQLATQFAELHDTPGRMKEKGVIDAVVPWEVSREFFYWRLRRRLEEYAVRKQLVAANPLLTPADLTGILHGWFARFEAASGPRRTGSSSYSDADIVALEQAKRVAAMSEDYDTAARLKREIEAAKAQMSAGTASGGSWDDDRRIVEWLDADAKEVQRRVASQRKKFIMEQVVGFGKEDMGGLVEGLQRLVDEVGSDDLHSMLKRTLRGPLMFGPSDDSPSFKTVD
eukprot:COSAG06_NODE_272_length_18674_cov_18.029717_5_plen_2141_part_00